MPATPAFETLLGCDPQVRVTVIEDAGNLVIQVFALSPDATDIDALFFNLNDDSVAADVTIFPAVDAQEITGFDVAPGTLNQMNNGAQLQEAFDVRVEFGAVPSTSGGDIDQAAFTLFLDGEMPLTVADIDLDTITAVVNSDGGEGLALSAGGGNPGQVPVTVTALSEDFDSLNGPQDSAAIASDAHWTVADGALRTDGDHDGALRLETVQSQGPVTLSFDIRAINAHAFEATGSYADSLRVEVQLGSGDWQLLDEFVVDEATGTFTGSVSGQTFGETATALRYEGGPLADAEGDVTFRIVSDISAGNEQFALDNLAVTVTELAGAIEPVTRVVQEDDFDGLGDAEDSAIVAGDTDWDLRGDALFTNGPNDGTITFEEVAASGPVGFSFDARAINVDAFENSGRYADSLDLQVQVDGGAWVTLDSFAVNDAGTALVGGDGQEFGSTLSTLSYAGGVLDAATDSVQFRFVSDISACNEKILIDNVTVTVTEDVPAPGQDNCEGFDAGEAGDVAADQFAGFSVTAQRAGDETGSQNDAMIFDSANPTGGDSDLGYDDRGNVLIISEDNDGDDPDDNAHGGTLTFTFDAPSEVLALTVLDTEEAGGTIDLFDAAGQSLGRFDIPVTGDNGSADVTLGVADVAVMEVTLTGSGAVDDLCFVPPAEPDEDCAQYAVSYDDVMVQDPPHPDPEPDPEPDGGLPDILV